MSDRNDFIRSNWLIRYVSTLAVVTMGVKKNFDLVLAAIAPLDVKMLVYLSSARSSAILLCLSATNLYIQIG